MLSRHERYEELGALAALGEVSVEESTELQAHFDVCPACRREYGEYRELVHNRLALADALPEPKHKFSISFLGQTLEDGVRERFFAEARRRGFRFSEEVERGLHEARGWWGLHASLLVGLFLIAAVAALGYQLRESAARRASGEAELSALNAQNALLRRHLSVLDKAANSSNSSGGNPRPENAALAPTPQMISLEVAQSNAAASAMLEAELARRAVENAALFARVRAVEERLQTAVSQNQSLQAEIVSGKGVEGYLTAKLIEAAATINQMTGELRNLREGRSSDAFLIAAQESRLKDWAEKLKEQSEAIERQKQLLVADRDIRDLLTARNLHIIDVFDVDSRGNTHPTFGRLFYTEGKSLIFYAFDVRDKRVLNANHAFQAWGYQESGGQSQSLGVFYADDRRQNRWALKFTDPRARALIDSIFVTIEPPGGSSKPTGQRMFYAYLRNKPNHP
ncbi:MAG: anti-sigma factor domain-containing protein [Blastocatellia bacterium]